MGLTIAIDGIFMASAQPGGYRTYTTNLVTGLAQVGGAHQFRLLLDQPANLNLPPNWRVDSLPRSGSLGFIWREQIALPGHVVANTVDVLHAPGATGPLRGPTPLVVTIYDAIEFTDPLPPVRQAKRWTMRVYSRFIQARAAQKARHIITISDYSKQQIVDRLGVTADKVTAIHLAPASHLSSAALDHSFDKITNSVRSGFVLGIASAAPRKNVSVLLQAYACMSETLRKEHPLLLVCTHKAAADTVRSKIAQLALDRDVQILQGIDDRTLAQLYRTAGVFVFPSLEEGFGLPPLEAMACGAPVIASNTSSLPEVLGDAAALVSPTDLSALAGAMEQILADHLLADKMRERGLSHSQQFSWDRTARATLAVYELVAVPG